MLPTALILAATLSLSTRFADIARPLDGTLGVYAQIVESGDAAGFNDTRRFPMQSVYKLPIAMAVLDQRTIPARPDRSPSRNADMVPRVHSPIRDAHPREGSTSACAS